MKSTSGEKPNLSKDELKKIAHGLNNFGEMLVMMGEIGKREEEMDNFDTLIKKLFQADNRDIIVALEKSPELRGKAATLTTHWEALSSTLGKDPHKMSPNEQIEAGEGLKEFSQLLKEIAEEIVE
jgi:hypothetical protein